MEHSLSINILWYRYKSDFFSNYSNTCTCIIFYTAYLANFKQNCVKNLRDEARLSLMTGRFCLRWPVRADI